MKETPIFEEVSMHLFRQPGVALKILIGGVLSFIPILNFFAFGYLYRVSLQLRNSGQLVLPEWADWQGLFIDGIKFGVVWLAYWLVPLLVSGLLLGAFSAIGLAAIGMLFVSVAVIAASVLFAAALYRFQIRGELRELLEVVLIGRMACMYWQRFVLPVLALTGLIALGLPLYGLAFFAAFLTFIIYSTVCFRFIEERKATYS